MNFIIPHRCIMNCLPQQKVYRLKGSMPAVSPTTLPTGTRQLPLRDTLLPDIRIHKDYMTAKPWIILPFNRRYFLRIKTALMIMQAFSFHLVIRGILPILLFLIQRGEG